MYFSKQTSARSSRNRVITGRNFVRLGRRDRRFGDSPTVQVLYDLFLLRSACEPEATFALAHCLALLGRHRTVRLRAVLLRAVGGARWIDRGAVTRGRRVVRSRGRRSSACTCTEEGLTVAVLAHAPIAAGTGPCAGPGGCCCCCCSSDAWLVTVRGDFGSREVRVACMPDYPVRVKVAVKVLVATAVAAPAKQTDKDYSGQSGNTAHNATNYGPGITTTAASRAGLHGWRDDDGGMDGGGNYLTIGSGRHEYRRKNRSRCAGELCRGRARSMCVPVPSR